MIDKSLIQKLEKQLEYIKNSKSDYQRFLENFKDMIKDNPELLDWIDKTYK